MINVRLIGAPLAKAKYEEMRLAAVLLGTMKLTLSAGDPSVGRTEAYAFGIETGHHRNGSLARRAGGAEFLKKGWAIVRASVGSRLAHALPGGPIALRREMIAVGKDGVELSRAFVPWRSGDLSRSIRSSFRSR